MVKTKIAATAPKYLLTIMDDDIEAAEARKTEIWNKKKKEIVLKGFRKGKVPREHAEKVIGYDNIYEDFIREVVAKGLVESGEKIVGVGQVVIDIFEANKPTVIRVETWLEPAVHLIDDEGNNLYEGLETSVEEAKVEDGEVEAVLQRMRDAAAVSQSVDRASVKGDAVIINFEGKLIDGTSFQGNAAKDYQVVIGSGILLPDFEAQLVGVKTGETRQIEIQFPDTYPNPDLVGKKAIFTTEIVDVKERTLPDLDDEFAKQMGYDNLADGRTKIAADLITNKEQQTKVQVEQQLLNGLIMSVKTDPIPGTMIKSQTENNIQQMLQGVGMTLEQYLKKANTTEEQLYGQYQQQAAIDVRARLILKAIAETEGLTATPEEEEAALKTLQPQYEGVDLETLRQQLDMDSLTLNIRVQKAMDFVREKSVVKKPSLAAPNVVVEPGAVKEKKVTEAEAIDG
jgi:trigger factor